MASCCFACLPLRVTWLLVYWRLYWVGPLLLNIAGPFSCTHSITKGSVGPQVLLSKSSLSPDRESNPANEPEAPTQPGAQLTCKQVPIQLHAFLVVSQCVESKLQCTGTPCTESTTTPGVETTSGVTFTTSAMTTGKDSTVWYYLYEKHQIVDTKTLSMQVLCILENILRFCIANVQNVWIFFYREERENLERGDTVYPSVTWDAMRCKHDDPFKITWKYHKMTSDQRRA